MTTFNNTALITGASSGIGKEFARIFAANGSDLIIVARRIDALNDLKKELEKKYNILIKVIGKDLSLPDSAQEIYKEVEGIDIKYLVNNAGFGRYGKYATVDWHTYKSMIDVNISSLSHLTHLFLKDFIRKNDGKILNVSSTAGFLPGPLMAVYYATKAYVNSFTEALAEELSDTNITVTALCPGPVATGFAETAKIKAGKLFNKVANAYDTALVGYKAMMKGKTIVISDKNLKFQLAFVNFLPRKLVLKVSRSKIEVK